MSAVTPESVSPSRTLAWSIRRDLADKAIHRQRIRVIAAAVCLAACAAAQAQETTVIDEPLFGLELPGQWQGGYNAKADNWQYRTSEGRETVTVNVIPRKTGPEMTAIKADLRKHLQAQRRSEAKRGGPKLALGKPEIQEREGAVLARYRGVDAGRSRRTFTRIIGNEVALGSFYYEATGLAAAAFDARAKLVLGNVGLIGR